MYRKKNNLKLTEKRRAGGDLPADTTKQEKQLEQFCKKGVLIKEKGREHRWTELTVSAAQTKGSLSM